MCASDFMASHPIYFTGKQSEPHSGTTFSRLGLLGTMNVLRKFHGIASNNC